MIKFNQLRNAFVRAKGRRHAVARTLAVVVALVLLAGYVAVRQFAAPTYAGPITVTANMGQFSPNPVLVGDPATASLSAYYTPPSGVPEGQLSASYDWSIGAVQYKALQADTFGSPPADSYTDSISPVQPSANSGATLTFTPETAGYWQISASCSVGVVNNNNLNQTWAGSATAGPADLTSYTFNMMYYGAEATTYLGPWNPVVTGQTIPIHAGWPIQLEAALAPSDLAANFTWTIAGAGGNGSAAINGYVASTTTGAPVVTGPGDAPPTAWVAALVPGNDTKSTFPDPASPGILKSYYYTESGSFTASVQPQGATGIPAAKTTFAVTKVATTMTVNYQYPTRKVTDGTGPAEILYLLATNSLGASSLTAQQAGILFTHPPVHHSFQGTGFFDGTSYFVQVYSEDDHWYGILPVVPDYAAVAAGLDGYDPYDTNGVDANGNDYVLDGPAETTDANANQINYSPVKINDSPEMWVMYTPSAPGSIDVPLDSATWHWGGTLTIGGPNLNIWTLTNKSPAAAGPVAAPATNTYPVWSQVLPVPAPTH